MPTSISSKKRLRQNLKRRARNRAAKSTLKTLVKKVREDIASKDLAGGEANFRAAARKLDQVAAKRIIHPNAAARVKSRLAKALKTAKQG